jgi:hypothetical protein
MYRKIDLKLPPIEIDRVKGDMAFEYHGGVLVLYKIKDLDYFENLYKDKIQFSIKPDLITYIEIIGPGAVPHIDGATATLNYTIDDASCITSFWRVDERIETAPVERVDEWGNLTKSKVMAYDERDLVRLTSFKANPGDAYLLDVSKIHSVFKPKYDTVRKFLSWRWVTTPFDTVSSSIILTN